jgi:hypothetical protein
MMDFWDKLNIILSPLNNLLGIVLKVISFKPVQNWLRKVSRKLHSIPAEKWRAILFSVLALLLCILLPVIIGRTAANGPEPAAFAGTAPAKEAVVLSEEVQGEEPETPEKKPAEEPATRAGGAAEKQFYRVVYLKNGAEGPEPAHGVGEHVTIAGGDALSKRRSVFTGWQSARGIHYRTGEVVRLSEDLVLTAQWKPLSVRKEQQEIPAGETCSFFSGELLVHLDRAVTKNMAREGAIPLYAYVVDGWIAGEGNRKALNEFAGGSTEVFSEIFDVMVTDIKQYSAEFIVWKYVPEQEE